MKILFPAIAMIAVALMAAGCDDGTAPNPGSAAPQSAPASTSSALTQVPNTTVIDGKTVQLQSYPDGLKYYDEVVGTGKAPKSGQTVSVQYTGTLLDGSKFDSTADRNNQPFDFAVGTGQVIKGWDEGVLPMKVGGKRRLVVPGNLAYGSNSPTPAIPSNATLVFDVELVAVK